MDFFLFFVILFNRNQNHHIYTFVKIGKQIMTTEEKIIRKREIEEALQWLLNQSYIRNDTHTTEKLMKICQGDPDNHEIRITPRVIAEQIAAYFIHKMNS